MFINLEVLVLTFTGQYYCCRPLNINYETYGVEMKSHNLFELVKTTCMANVTTNISEFALIYKI